MVATSSTCYDAVTFLTQCGKSASNFVAISSLVVKLLKKCRVRLRVGHSVLRFLLLFHPGKEIWLNRGGVGGWWFPLPPRHLKLVRFLYLRGLTGKYLAIFNISRTDRVAMM